MQHICFLDKNKQTQKPTSLPLFIPVVHCAEWLVTHPWLQEMLPGSVSKSPEMNRFKKQLIWWKDHLTTVWITFNGLDYFYKIKFNWAVVSLKTTWEEVLFRDKLIIHPTQNEYEVLELLLKSLKSDKGLNLY